MRDIDQSVSNIDFSCLKDVDLNEMREIFAGEEKKKKVVAKLQELARMVFNIKEIYWSALNFPCESIEMTKKALEMTEEEFNLAVGWLIERGYIAKDEEGNYKAV